MRTSFTYQCAQLWNNLPEDVKLADDVNIFKSKLRSTQLYNFYIYIFFCNFYNFLYSCVHRLWIIYIYICCVKKRYSKKAVFFTLIYICKKDSFFTKMYFVKKRSYSKCCWWIQLVFILKLFSLYKCFLAFFSISKIKHSLAYVTDRLYSP